MKHSSPSQRAWVREEHTSSLRRAQELRLEAPTHRGAYSKLYRDDREEFDEHYHQRSRVESVLKKVFGNHLSSRRRSQRNEHS